MSNLIPKELAPPPPPPPPPRDPRGRKSKSSKDYEPPEKFMDANLILIWTGFMDVTAKTVGAIAMTVRHQEGRIAQLEVDVAQLQKDILQMAENLECKNPDIPGVQ